MRQIGRLGQLLVGEEAAYGTAPALLAAMALRHMNFTANYQPKNRVWSDEKKSTRGRKARFDRAMSAGFNLSALLRPSGTLGTIPEAHKVLQHAFGVTVVGTLNTTVSAGTGSASTFPLTSVAGLTVGEWVSVRRAANGNVPEARHVTAIAGSDVTVSPALGASPAAADTVKAGVTYKIGTIAKSLAFAHFLTDLTRIVKGGVINELSLAFDRNKEVEFTAAGPAQQAPRPAPASPGFTTVGAQNPPSGLVGGLLINGTARKFMTMEISLDNGLDLINENYGTLMAEGYDAPEFRELTFSLERRADDDFTLYDLAEAGTQFELFLQTGQTEGNIIAVRAPKAEFEQVPELPDDNGALTHSFAGVLAENTGDDELSLGLL